jgi:two-component system sensor histidine kinase KdpD
LTLGQKLSTSADADSIRDAGSKALAHALRCHVAILARDAEQVMRVVASVPLDAVLISQDLAAADWGDRH